MPSRLFCPNLRLRDTTHDTTAGAFLAPLAFGVVAICREDSQGAARFGSSPVSPIPGSRVTIGIHANKWRGCPIFVQFREHLDFEPLRLNTLLGPRADGD